MVAVAAAGSLAFDANVANLNVAHAPARHDGVAQAGAALVTWCTCVPGRTASPEASPQPRSRPRS